MTPENIIYLILVCTIVIALFVYQVDFIKIVGLLLLVLGCLMLLDWYLTDEKNPKKYKLSGGHVATVNRDHDKIASIARQALVLP